MTNQFQIWHCNLCGRDRHWGFGPPSDVALVTLNCGRCHARTPHAFTRVLTGTRDEFPGIDWGDYKPRQPMRVGQRDGVEW